MEYGMLKIRRGALAALISLRKLRGNGCLKQ